MRTLKMNKIIKAIFVTALAALLIPSCEVGLGEAVDINPPVLTVTSPVIGGSVSTNYTISGTATDDTGVKDLTITVKKADAPDDTAITYMWDGEWKKKSSSGWESCSEATFTGNAKNFSWSIELSAAGASSGDEYSLNGIVTDNYDNGSSASKDERSFIVDVVDPIASIILPSPVTTYSEALSKHNSYNTKDSTILSKLINKNFTISGTQTEDSHLGVFKVMLDKGTSDNVTSYTLEPELRNVATNLVCVKTLETGSRSWEVLVNENDIPEAYRTGKQLFRIITETHDKAGNVERKVQGWITYWNEADKPWVVMSLGDSEYKVNGQFSVYPSCSLQAQCYDDDGLRSIEADIYVYDSTTSQWNIMDAKHLEMDLTEEGCPGYCSWSINAIAENKHFKIVSKCKDVNGVESETVTKFFSVLDVNPPELTITSPVNGSKAIGTASGDITFTGTVKDDGSLKESDGCYLKMVRIQNNQKQNIVDYYDENYSGWNTETNGNKIFTIPLTGSHTPVGGYCNYTFTKTFNIFTDFGISKTEVINSQLFIFKMNDKSSATINSLSLQGDTEAPQLAITTLKVRNSSGTVKATYDFATLEDALPPFNTGDQIQYSGTWSDDSAMYWSPAGSKIGDLTLESKGVTLTANPRTNGSWETNWVTPNDSTTATMSASLKDWGGNVARANVSYYISSSNPVLARISSVNPDGSYKQGDVITITLEYNKKVTFTGSGAILTLNNGGTARYDTSSETNGSAKHYYKYTVGNTEKETLTVTSINKNNSEWEDSDKHKIQDPEALPSGYNLGDVRKIKIDMTAPKVKKVEAITGSGSYKANTEMFFKVIFSEYVTFDELNQVQLKLKVGTVTKTLTNATQVSDTEILYKYTAGSSDNGQITFDSISKNGCSIKDKAGNELTATAPDETSLNAIIVDTTPPVTPTVDGDDGIIVYTPGGKSVTVTYPSDADEKYYSVDNGSTWVKYTSGINLTAKGTYKIKAYCTDLAGNESAKSDAKTVTLEPGEILTSITSSTPDGTYTNNSKGVIYITLKFTKDVIVTGSKLKLNVTDKTNQTAVRYANPVSEPSGGAKSITYKYTVQENDSCEELQVDDFIFTTITDTLPKKTGSTEKNNIAAFVQLENLEDGMRLEDNRSIAILTGKPEVQSIDFASDGKSFSVTFSAAFNKGTGSIKLKMQNGSNGKTTFRAPGVMEKTLYDGCSSEIKAYYSEGTNGASFANSKLNSDLTKKYILDFDTATNNETLVNLFVTDKKDEVTIPIDSTAVTIDEANPKKLNIDLSSGYTLPVKGATYDVTIPAGLVKNVLEVSNDAESSTFLAPGVENPCIRIKKSKETITFTNNNPTVTLPTEADVKIDCQTPGSKIYYKKDQHTSSAKKFSTIGTVMAKDSATDFTAAPEFPDAANAYSDNTVLNYTDYSTFKIGSSEDNTNGYKILITARAYITVGTTKRYSSLSYEAAYRSVVLFKDGVTKNGYSYRWIRGGDAPGGGVSTPGFPFNWNTDDYGQVRAMAKIGDYWTFMTWAINTDCYFQFLAGDMPKADAATKGPSKWCWSSCSWIGVKIQYPLYPGECREMDSSSPKDDQAGGYAYQDKHVETR